jgi:aquaporin Z
VNLKALRPLVAECVGTALFVFLGAGSVIVNAATSHGLGVVGIAAAHGVGMAVLVSMTMAISGGHLNPAVSFGLWVAKKIDAVTLGKYVGAQLVGAVIGALLLKGLLPATATRITSLGTPAFASAIEMWAGIGIEAVLTLFLVSAVFGTAVSPQAPKIGGFGIGLAIFVCALAAGPFTGAAMNPARAFGPALVSWDWHAQVAYWVGPAIGAAAAAALWRYVLLPRDAAQIN